MKNLTDKQKILNQVSSSILYILCFVWCSNIYSQVVSTYNVLDMPKDVASPASTSLGSFGIVPVSPYTGKANVSIPIYSCNVNGINLDIHLSYDTSGLLMNNLPCWTGHGWTLMAGGAITRAIKNQPDELDYSDTNSGWNYYIQDSLENAHYTASKQPDLFNQECTREVAKYASYTNYFSNAPIVSKAVDYSELEKEFTGMADYSADIFYFNFMGINGCFFYGNDGNWKVQCDKNISVIFDVKDSRNYISNFENYYPDNDIVQPKTIKGFTILDENGNKYVFGGDKSSIEYVTDLMSRHRYNTSEPWKAITWMLTDVYDRFGNRIYSFKYSHDKNIVQIYNTLMCVYGENGNILNSNQFPPISASLNAPVYLDEIKIMNGVSLKFVHENIYAHEDAYKELYPSFVDSTDNNWERLIGYAYREYKNNRYFNRYFQEHPMVGKQDLSTMDLEKLNSIIVNFNDSVINYKYDFSYNYESRMHLESLSVQKGKGNVNKYTFEYNGYKLIPNDYLTCEIDYEGYYNGPELMTDTIPHNPSIISHDLISTPVSLKKAAQFFKLEPWLPSLLYSKYGMLTRIKYPTGGTTEFEYELNTCCKYVKDDRSEICDLGESCDIGGLRIKSITNIDNDSVVSKKSYFYCLKDSSLSSGELYTYRNDYLLLSDNVRIGTKYSVFPLSNSFFPTVGYSCVKEVGNDGSYIYYTYSNYSNEKDDKYDLEKSFNLKGIKVNRLCEYSSRNYMRGLILSKEYYDANDKIISSQSYTYNSDSIFNSMNFVNTTSKTVIETDNMDYLFGNRYKLYYPKVSLASMTNKEYYDNGVQNKITTFRYEDSKLELNDGGDSNMVDISQLKKTSQICGGDTVDITYNYANTLDGWTNKCLVNQFCLAPIAKKQYLNGQLIGGTRTVYGKCGNNYVPVYDLKFYNNDQICDTVTSYISYSKSFKPQEVVDVYGIRHRYYWDSKGRLVKTVDNSHSPLKYETEHINTTANAFYVNGLLASTNSANNMTSYYNYNMNNELAAVLDGDKNIVQKIENNVYSSLGSNNDIQKLTIETASVSDESNPVKENYIDNVSYSCENKQLSIQYVLCNDVNSCKISIYAKDNKTYNIDVDCVSSNGKGSVNVNMSSIIDNVSDSQSTSLLKMFSFDCCVELYVNGKNIDSSVIDVPLHEK